MFNLISVDRVTEINAVKLQLDGNSFLLREFDSDKYVKGQLIIYGLKKENLFIQEMRKFIDNYIDVEELTNKKLDFWSDADHIGKFVFDKYEEVIVPFRKDDWIKAYQSLIEYHYQNSDDYIASHVRWNKFINNLKFIVNKEIENFKTKSKFLAIHEKTVINSNKKVLDLANKIQNLIEEYIKE